MKVNSTLKKLRFSKYFLLILLPLVAFSTLYFLVNFGKKDLYTIKNPKTNISKPIQPVDKKLKLLFVGDIFLDRGIDAKSQKSELKYSYPFSKLYTLERYKYDAWIGNLECPVTVTQSTLQQKEVDLKFSCKKEYLPELKNYFDIVSLANNHTNNMGDEAGLRETQAHLNENGIKYFGHFDPEKGENCKVINIQNVPIAFCGYHGVYKLPSEKDLEEIKMYSKYFFTVAYPHQGAEYESLSNSYQKIIYRAMILNGADMVVESHPHVIQNVEIYKGKYIFYSLGNFIFDQAWSKTREHMTLDTELTFKNFKNPYKDLDCEQNIDSCIIFAKDHNLEKEEVDIKVTPIFTRSETDFLTKKWELGTKEYQAKLRQIGFK